MWPADHSSGSRTSTRTTPLPSCSCTSAGSTSSIRLLIWRRISAPDGLMDENSSKAVQIQYFTQYRAKLAHGRLESLELVHYNRNPPRGVPHRSPTRA